MKEIKAWLVLADGLTFEGLSFGAIGESIGEVVFNTSLTGYQEIITDPSYKGQMVVMTYPEIGNYGVNLEDVESGQPHLEAFIVRNYNDVPSNFRSKQSLGAYLHKNKIMGITGIDTRALTRHLRDHGSQMAILTTQQPNLKELKKRLAAMPSMVGRDVAQHVTSKEKYGWNEALWTLEKGHFVSKKKGAKKVVAYDFGIKRNILRGLVSAGCNVTVVPASTTAEAILAMNPDGIFLSNGPGDPEPVAYAVENIKKLIGKKPIFGICLGHQLLALALGGKTYKLKFGHHGGNQPVMDLETGKVEITSQNHNFAVDMDSLKGKAEVTHVNLNDKTVEGMKVKGLPVFSVQYHPEASPGPHDSSYLFERFVNMMES